jgi:hypothetical protein
MSVVQQFEYTWPDGMEQIQFLPWIATLTQEEQDEFAQAKTRQDAIKQQWVDDGLLSIIPEGYEWKDQETFDNGKPNDPVWLEYWGRWVSETQVQFSPNTINLGSIQWTPT